MKKTLYANPHNMLVHGNNSSFGNHLLHLFFCLNFSIKRNLNFKIPVNSNLDLLFNLSEYKETIPPDTVCVFREEYNIGDVNDHFNKDCSNLITSFKMLYEKKINLPDNFYVEGWFSHVSLFPSYSDFCKLKIHNNLKNEVIEKFSEVLKENSICMHYRGTDFGTYYGWGDSRLPLNYYKKCLKHIIENHKHIKNVFVFTDDNNFQEKIKLLEKEFPNFIFKRISEQVHIDWLIMHLSKNIISSNSTFALTATAYNKNVSYQPSKFLLHNKENCDFSIPPNPFFIFSHII
jgi:hypothetical protein